MNDKQMLELAAKAAGHTDFEYDESGSLLIATGDGLSYFWNPITDDGDALRLAVKLQIVFGKYDDYANAAPLGENDIDIVVWLHQEKDPYAATRLAITRAAAEIGMVL